MLLRTFSINHLTPIVNSFLQMLLRTFFPRVSFFFFFFIQNLPLDQGQCILHEPPSISCCIRQATKIFLHHLLKTSHDLHRLLSTITFQKILHADFLHSFFSGNRICDKIWGGQKYFFFIVKFVKGLGGAITKRNVKKFVRSKYQRKILSLKNIYIFFKLSSCKNRPSNNFFFTSFDFDSLMTLRLTDPKD